jgi:hypothetical protein
MVPLLRLLEVSGFDDETRKKVDLNLIPDWNLSFFIMANGELPKPK